MLPPDLEPVDGAPDLAPGPNLGLPALSFFKARSTVAAILTVAGLLGPLIGGGLGEMLTEVAANAELIQAQTKTAIDAFNALLGVAGLAWLWWERRAPNFRLTFGRG